MKDCRLYLLDMDGTLYLGDNLFYGVTDFLSYIKEIGGRYLFLTNNSSKSVSDYKNKLIKLGISATDDDFFTSTQATVHYLKMHYKDTLLYALGTQSFKDELIRNGLSVTDKVEDGIGALVMGFDTELTFQKLHDASVLLCNDIPYIATNPDLVCPTEFGYVPDCGSISQALFNATGKKPFFIGKPRAEMAYLAIEKTGYKKEEAVLIGDRIYTDIACANNAGIKSVLVLSGETTKEDLEKSEIKPTFVYQDVYEILKDLKI